MPNIRTAKEMGLAIRSRRRELGWDQATLAQRMGVTRQWVIKIEQGKPRAELALAMRALHVLGLSLAVEAEPQDAASRSDSQEDRKSGAATLRLIDAIVERNRGGAASRLAESLRLQPPKTAVDRLMEIERAKPGKGKATPKESVDKKR